MTKHHDAQDDDDLIRFLLDELDDEAQSRLHDRLQNDPAQRAQLTDLDHALTALEALRDHATPQKAEQPRQPPRHRILLSAAAAVLAFLLGMLVPGGNPTDAAIDVNAQAFYDSYTAQPADRSELGRTLVAYMKASRER